MKAEMKQEATERPILFSGAMVNAILEGRKTQTRRVVKARNVCDECLQGENAPNNYSDLVEPNGEVNMAGAIFGTVPYLKTGFCSHNDVSGERIRCPYGKPGDRLWVRETWAIADCGRRVSLSPDAWPEGFPVKRLQYISTDEAPSTSKGKPYWWNSRVSIHMPRWASRITLEITNVRVERLQDISEEDALAEGMKLATQADGMHPPAREQFARLWDNINGKKHPWANPWVWVVEFKRI